MHLNQVLNSGFRKNQNSPLSSGFNGPISSIYIGPVRGSVPKTSNSSLVDPYPQNPLYVNSLSFSSNGNKKGSIVTSSIEYSAGPFDCSVGIIHREINCSLNQESTTRIIQIPAWPNWRTGLKNSVRCSWIPCL